MDAMTGDGTGARAPRRWLAGAAAAAVGRRRSRRRATVRRARCRLDRTVGVVLGLAAGNADAERAGRRRDADVRAGGRGVARPRLAGAGGARRAAVRGSCTRCGSRGEAIDAAVDGAAGPASPWYLAASTSYGNAALGRAAAVGAVFAGEPAAVGLAASVDAAVTHAERRATAASAALAAIVAGLIRRGPRDDAASRSCRAVVAACAGADRRATCSRRRWRRWTTAPTCRGSGAGASAPPRRWPSPCGARSSTDDPGRRRSPRRRTCEHGSHAAGAVTGALVGAIHGAAALPAAGTATSRAPRATRGSPGASPQRRPDADRSTSERCRHLVPARPLGLDAVDRPRRRRRVRRLLRQPSGPTGGEATVTVVQFDDDDPHEVLVDAAPLDAVRSIAGRFEPRGIDAAVRRHRAAARPRRAPRRRRRRPARRRPHRRRRERQPRLDPAAAVRPHRRAARPRLDVRVPRRQPGQLRRRRRRRRPRRQHQQLRARARRACRRPTTASTGRSASGGASRASARRRDRDDFWGGRKEAEEQMSHIATGSALDAATIDRAVGAVLASAAGDAMGAPVRVRPAATRARRASSRAAAASAGSPASGPTTRRWRSPCSTVLADGRRRPRGDRRGDGALVRQPTDRRRQPDPRRARRRRPPRPCRRPTPRPSVPAAPSRRRRQRGADAHRTGRPRRARRPRRRRPAGRRRRRADPPAPRQRRGVRAVVAGHRAGDHHRTLPTSRSTGSPPCAAGLDHVEPARRDLWRHAHRRGRRARPDRLPSQQRVGRRRLPGGAGGDHVDRRRRRTPSPATTSPPRCAPSARAGGDTDTVAAIAGALLGARWGATAVPLALAPPPPRPADLRRTARSRAADLDAMARLAVRGGRPDGERLAGRRPHGLRTDAVPASSSSTAPGSATSAASPTPSTGGATVVVSLCRMGDRRRPAAASSTTPSASSTRPPPTTPTPRSSSLDTARTIGELVARRRAGVRPLRPRRAPCADRWRRRTSSPAASTSRRRSLGPARRSAARRRRSSATPSPMSRGSAGSDDPRFGQENRGLWRTDCGTEASDAGAPHPASPTVGDATGLSGSYGGYGRSGRLRGAVVPTAVVSSVVHGG